jgi:hypothetical protein
VSEPRSAQRTPNVAEYSRRRRARLTIKEIGVQTDLCRRRNPMSKLAIFATISGAQVRP